MSKILIRAVSYSTFAMIGTVMSGLWIAAVIGGEPPEAAAHAMLTHLAFFLFLFGFPFCFLLVAIVGASLAGYEAKQDMRMSWLGRYLFPMVLGGLGLPVGWYLFWGGIADELFLACMGVVLGLVAAGTFWKALDSNGARFSR